MSDNQRILIVIVVKVHASMLFFMTIFEFCYILILIKRSTGEKYTMNQTEETFVSNTTDCFEVRNTTADKSNSVITVNISGRTPTLCCCTGSVHPV